MNHSINNIPVEYGTELPSFTTNPEYSTELHISPRIMYGIRYETLLTKNKVWNTLRTSLKPHHKNNVQNMEQNPRIWYGILSE